jgi:hypothetical protein
LSTGTTPDPKAAAQLAAERQVLKYLNRRQMFDLVLWTMFGRKALEFFPTRPRDLLGPIVVVRRLERDRVLGLRLYPLRTARERLDENAFG